MTPEGLADMKGRGKMRPQTLRVLHVTTSFPSSTADFSGRFLSQLVWALQAHNTACHVLAPAGPVPQPRVNSSVTRFRYAPWRFQRLAAPGGGIPHALRRRPHLHLLVPPFMASMATHVAALAGRYDLIHAHWSVCGAAAVLARPIHRKPVITTFRGTDLLWSRSRAMYSAVTRMAVSGSSLITAVAEEMVAELKQAYPRHAGRFVFVPNGVAEEFYAVEAAERPLPPPLRLLFVGNLTDSKGAGVLLEAMARLIGEGEWQLDFVGEGPEESTLRALVSRSGLGGRIHFAGVLPFSEMPRCMATHHVLVLPSMSEGRPNVVLEAMAASMAVVGSDIAGIRELVSDGVNGWLTVRGDPASLADILGRLIRGELDWARGGRMGRAWMREKALTWPRSAMAYRALYEQALGRIGQRRG